MASYAGLYNVVQSGSTLVLASTRRERIFGLAPESAPEPEPAPDPLYQIPDINDQVSFLAQANLLQLSVCVGILCLSIWALYKGKTRGDNPLAAIGGLGIIAALVLNGLHQSFGDLRAPVTESMVAGFNTAEFLTMQIAAFLYKLTGGTGPAIIAAVVGISPFAFPVALIIAILRDRSILQSEADSQPAGTLEADQPEESESSTDGQESNLVTCPDCGAQISKRAQACPKCGCPAEFFHAEIDSST